MVNTRFKAMSRTISLLALGSALAAPAMATEGRPQSEESPDGNVIIVTAQKQEEAIQDVPIAISAFSADMLDAYKIESGSELLRAVPNVSFSKSNFSMYNFSIRGIGTKAISASSDPAVAVSFNNTPLIRNRLFESELFDMQRIEVLRGPQGTLYGRNATAGVVNLIPALPDDEFGLDTKLEVGNFKTMRASGMINVPLTDTLAIRAAGALTSRDGFDYNTFTDRRVNGRELWSSRLSMQWEPSDRLRVNAIWQHFEEDDDRSRTGKQLCTRDPGPETVNGIRIPDGTQPGLVTPFEENLRGRFSQGCQSASLYDDAAYGTPNGSGLAFVVAGQVVIPMGDHPSRPFESVYAFLPTDPFLDATQSRDLREIATEYDPVFRAKNDVFQGNLEFDVTDSLTFVSQTSYARDRYYSSQDYNRFVSGPLFSDTTGLLDLVTPISQDHAAPGGIFCDPQLGCSNRLLSVDLSRSRNRQWSQEFRLQSDFDGPFNFNLGVNYLDFKTQDDYFVFNNAFTYIAYNLYNRSPPFGPSNYDPCPIGTTGRDCVYVDPNPIDSLDEQGHNYFLSRNLVRTKSWAVFGEAYWDVTDNLKVTAGLRWTKDKKITTPVQSQLLLGGGGGTIGTSGGYVSSGYPSDPDVVQKWSEPTGRIVVDWKPDLGFTDQTLIYASASRGYKGGGTNPPRPNLHPRIVQFQPLPSTFKPEFVNAFEIGTKNSFDGGRFTLNATAFYYDYKDYQISQIVDRISLNENFDATSWGLELETAWRPSRAFQVDANLGYLQTRLKKGAKSIDVMNRTQGNPDWVLLRPWIQLPSNCIAPAQVVEDILSNPVTQFGLGLPALQALCGGSKELGTFDPSIDGLALYQFYGFEYNPITDAPNGGRGFFADLEGNELPNAPRLTFNIGAQYTFFINDGDWELTLRGDYYRQSKSFARVYNSEYDRLKGWSNANLAITLDKPSDDLTFQFYVKNLFDKTPITDFFTNSDDTGLSTNVFTLDPRIFGFSVAKKF
ncbi:MAG: TonB-dependent receptor [Parasphingorhabdus sp.]